MINEIMKSISDGNFTAGFAGITVSLGGRLLQVNTIISDLHGILGLIVNLFLAIVYIATAVWLLTQTVNLKDQIVERRKKNKK